MAQAKTRALRLIAFIRSIHKEATRHRRGAGSFQKFSPLRGIPRIPGGQTPYQGAFSGRGNQMKFGCPASSGFSDGLVACFF